MSIVDERIYQLEIRYTYLEEKVEVLNTVVIEKEKEIDALKRKIDSLEQTIANSMESPVSEKPPHY